MNKILTCLLFTFLILMGCETIPVGEMTEEQKKQEATKLLKKYNAHYVPDKSGFCVENEVPEQDRWILNCEYANMCCE